MTVEELCDALRNTHPSREMCKEAADVIERLAAEVERLTTLMSGNVRLVEELEDGAIFEVGPGVRSD